MTMTGLDTDLAVLRGSARRWAALPPSQRRQLLGAVRAATAQVAPEWVRAACRAKGLRPDSPAAGEEWTSGPYAVLSYVSALSRVLARLEAGTNPLDPARVRHLTNGRLAVRAFPDTVRDLTLAGYSSEVWLRPGVRLQQASEGIARRLRGASGDGTVTAVLGAGNISSIPVLDALGKLVQDGAVVLVKLNPVTAYLEPILARALGPLIDPGFLRITSGGVQTGEYLVRHGGVDTVHITGSAASHDAIVFGPGAEGARRRRERRPLVTKPVTSELGGVGPVIVAPGRWSDATLRAQAENVATQRLHNSGFNCIATQIVVLPRAWPQAEPFLAHLRAAIRGAPQRPAYYPGARARQRAAFHAHPRAELLGGDPDAPRTLLPDLHPDDADEPALRTEYFAPVLGIARLPGVDVGEFLDTAVDFCNERLAGTLSVGLIVDGRTRRALGPRFDAAVTRLRYGTVALNCWVGVVYAMPRATWGAFPGHELADIGSGIGIVHNAGLLDPQHVERTVGRGPFRPWPRPMWDVHGRTAHIVGEHMTRLAAEPGPVRSLAHLAATVGASVRN